MDDRGTVMDDGEMIDRRIDDDQYMMNDRDGGTWIDHNWIMVDGWIGNRWRMDDVG